MIAYMIAYSFGILYFVIIDYMKISFLTIIVYLMSWRKLLYIDVVDIFESLSFLANKELQMLRFSGILVDIFIDNSASFLLLATFSILEHPIYI